MRIQMRESAHTMIEPERTGAKRSHELRLAQRRSMTT